MTRNPYNAMSGPPAGEPLTVTMPRELALDVLAGRGEMDLFHLIREALKAET